MLVNVIGFLAEAADHHPDLSVTWAKVWVKLQTHSAGGITDKDFALARKIEETALWRPEPGSPLQGAAASEFVKVET
jgi:4a-hydroxytetrahydrobiopterin dehydratase